MASKKPKVDISAGAKIVVEIEGAEYRFDCTSASRGTTKPNQVAKRIQDCVTSAIASATKRHAKVKPKKDPHCLT